MTLPDLQQAAYRYNALKQRVGKTLPGGVVTRYVYGLDGLLLAELDGLNNVLKEYVYLQGRLLAVRDFSGGAGQVYYAHNDHLGAPRLLTDAAARTVWRGDFDPFGKPAAIDEDPDGDGVNVSLNIRFPGQYYDAETGLHYNWHRYYDHETGRYTSSDPIGFEGGLNTYAYVGGNPVGAVDPDGLEVRVVTSDTNTYRILSEAYARLNSTKRGIQICDKLEKSPDVFQIMETNEDAYYCPAGAGSHPKCGGHERTVFMDAYKNPLLMESTGLEEASKAAVLGHELGHAIGDLDDGPGDMNNVNKNENPVRDGLGEPRRTAYPVPTLIWVPGTK